jgi:membrane protein YqaA with SNARE-associated domain
LHITAVWVNPVIEFFRGLGVFGPFLLEALDSSFLYLPLANELLLVALISSGESRWMWAAYAAMAAAGSLAGVLLADSLVRPAGEKGLEKFVKPERARRLKRKLERSAGWAVFAASVCPPPFPFRAVVLTASALQSPRAKLLTAVFLGRLVRFTAEALLILYFGRTLLRYMNSRAFEYAVYALGAVAAVGSILVLRKGLSR